MSKRSTTPHKQKSKKNISINLFNNQVKEFSKDFTPEDNLWTTSRDVKRASFENMLERAGLEPSIYGHMSKEKINQLTRDVRRKDFATAQQRRKYVKDMLKKMEEEQKDNVIKLKRQPPLTPTMLQSPQTHSPSSATKKGGRHRKHGRMTRRK